jgi:hypothetical protein
MQQTPIGACSIAWFKLSQLVDRKEKEKALGLYKLMSYSLENKAYALQIEADLLLAFEDDGVAMEKYKQAAYLYKKEKNIVLAASIYEHLREMQPENHNFLSTLVELYARMDWTEKMEERFNTMLDCYENKKISEDEVVKTVKMVKDLFILEKKDDLLKNFIHFVHVKKPNFPVLTT